MRILLRPRMSWAPSIIVGAAAALFVIAVIVHGTREEVSHWLMNEKFASFIGAVVGGLVAALSAILVWKLAVYTEQTKEDERIQRIAKTMWVEITMLSLTLVDEGKWWVKTQQEMFKEKQKYSGLTEAVRKDPAFLESELAEKLDWTFRKTQLRLFSHLNLLVVERNLDVFPELGERIADLLIRILSLRSGLLRASEVYYTFEDKIAESKDIDFVDALEKRYDNCTSLTLAIMRLAAELNYTANLLDSDRYQTNQLIKSLSPADKEDYDEAMMLIGRWTHIIRQRIAQERAAKRANPAK